MPGREEVPKWKTRNGWFRPRYARTYHFFVTDRHRVVRDSRPGTETLCENYGLGPGKHLLPIEKVEGRVCESCVRRFKEDFYDILEVL